MVDPEALEQINLIIGLVGALITLAAFIAQLAERQKIVHTLVPGTAPDDDSHLRFMVLFSRKYAQTLENSITIPFGGRMTNPTLRAVNHADLKIKPELELEPRALTLEPDSKLTKYRIYQVSGKLDREDLSLTTSFDGSNKIAVREIGEWRSWNKFLQCVSGTISAVLVIVAAIFVFLGELLGRNGIFAVVFLIAAVVAALTGRYASRARDHVDELDPPTA